MAKFKVIINGVEQQGTFTAEECGDKTCQLLRMMGSVTIEYKRVRSTEKKASPFGL